MGYKIPWSNFHELNLDWLLEQVKQLRNDVDSIIGSSTPSTSIPEMDGVGSPGTEDKYARGDHRHPTDTSRAAQSDLTQEITDRGNADLALASDIADVDAKIKFSAAAPLMNSSSASAGFSDFMARADHIHPTDTSRASATDLATLTARVDAFSGSALPSDLTPNMDGVGAAGTGGNYSRGDHVHPSDTSKLDVAGGTITGLLTQTYKERHITVDAIGWLRVANIPQVNGTKATITVTRKSTLYPDEVHTIDILINQAGVVFDFERSSGSVLYIDEIRYTNAGKLDIHMDQSYESDVGVFLEPMTADGDDMGDVHLIPIVGVADAPGGETILASHKFTDDTTYHNLTLTRTNNSYFNATNVARIRPCTKNDILTVHFNLTPDTNIPANTSLTEIARITLPPNRKLAYTCYNTMDDQTGTEAMLVQISEEGIVAVGNYSASALSEFCRGVFTTFLIPTT